MKHSVLLAICSNKMVRNYPFYMLNYDVKISSIDWVKEFDISHVQLKHLLQLLLKILLNFLMIENLINS